MQFALYHHRHFASNRNRAAVLGDDLLTLGAHNRVAFALGDFRQERLDLVRGSLVEDDNAAGTDQRTVKGIGCRTVDDFTALIEAELTGGQRRIGFRCCQQDGVFHRRGAAQSGVQFFTALGRGAQCVAQHNGCICACNGVILAARGCALGDA